MRSIERPGDVLSGGDISIGQYNHRVAVFRVKCARDGGNGNEVCRPTAAVLRATAGATVNADYRRTTLNQTSTSKCSMLSARPLAKQLLTNRDNTLPAKF
jgi:hypothetical protein